MRWTQNPVSLGRYYEPQPDLVLIEGQLSGRLPGPTEIGLVVEVSDATLAYDRRVKLPLYASFGIPEAWIVDLDEDRVEVHFSPGSQGYRLISRFGRNQQLVSATIPNLDLAAEKVLPPRQASSEPDRL